MQHQQQHQTVEALLFAPGEQKYDAQHLAYIVKMLCFQAVLTLNEVTENTTLPLQREIMAQK